MQENEISSLLESTEGDGLLLKNIFVCEPEIEEIQKKVGKQIEEVEGLAKSNQDTK